MFERITFGFHTHMFIFVIIKILYSCIFETYEFGYIQTAFINYTNLIFQNLYLFQLRFGSLNSFFFF